jgi:HupE / UreJ protein
MKKIIPFLLLLPLPAFAHNVGMGKADVQIAGNGTITASVDFDLVAWTVGVEPAQLNIEHIRRLAAMTPNELQGVLDAARRRLEDGCSFAPAANVRFELPPDAQFRGALHTELVPLTMPSNFTVTATGSLAHGERAVSVRFPSLMGAFLLTVQTPDREPFQQLLLPGEKSPPCAVSAGALEEKMSRGQAATRYLLLGFTHILPKGLDHILFVLGLFLLSPKLKPLLWQVTAFTVAHSLTLALSLYGIFSLSPRIVEPLIAASITFVAVENLCTSRLHPWRPLVVFGFGLVHGLGFAGVLSEFGLPRHQFVTALISFNLGVECGQLGVLSLAALVVGWFFWERWYRGAVVIPASCAIAMVGAYWTIERILG